jgi:aspartyl-tRNA(Asn)/glutamyl-tRNA(Gln) amidotransferase subunit C
MKITNADALRVAQLAHLELSSEELETYRGQLDEILTYIDKLKELDVENVEPMAQVLFTSSPADGNSANSHPNLRDDILRPCDVAPAILAQATDAAKPFFRVPKVIDR